MTDVFLLVAGFSRAISELNDCGPTFMPLTDEIGQELNARNLIPNKALSAGDKFEEWMTYLAQSQPWQQNYEAMKNRGDFLSLTDEIAKIIERQEEVLISKALPDLLRAFLVTASRLGTIFITTNYDTIIERAMWQMGSQDTEDLYPAVLSPAFTRQFGAIPSAGNQYDLTLCKLHGSTNWRWAAGPESPLYLIRRPWKSKSNEETEDLHQSRDLKPYVVPPTFDKTGYLSHGSLQYTWQVARESVINATRLFVIGYSLPEADITMRYLFLRPPECPTISAYIIDTGKKSELVNRYEKAFPDSYSFNGDYCGLSDPVSEFITNYCENNL